MCCFPLSVFCSIDCQRIIVVFSQSKRVVPVRLSTRLYCHGDNFIDYPHASSHILGKLARARNRTTQREKVFLFLSTSIKTNIFLFFVVGWLILALAPFCLSLSLSYQCFFLTLRLNTTSVCEIGGLPRLSDTVARSTEIHRTNERVPEQKQKKKKKKRKRIAIKKRMFD
jgi:hypothetical protein